MYVVTFVVFFVLSERLEQATSNHSIMFANSFGTLKQKKIWNPALFGIRNPVLGIRNPQRGIQNPGLSLIPLHGAIDSYKVIWVTDLDVTLYPTLTLRW